MGALAHATITCIVLNIFPLICCCRGRQLFFSIEPIYPTAGANLYLKQTCQLVPSTIHLKINLKPTVGTHFCNVPQCPAADELPSSAPAFPVPPKNPLRLLSAYDDVMALLSFALGDTPPMSSPPRFQPSQSPQRTLCDCCPRTMVRWLSWPSPPVIRPPRRSQHTPVRCRG